MNSFVKGLALLTATVAFTSPALAEVISPEGQWTTGTKDSRYEVTLCGKGDQLCGKLVWLQYPSKELSPYLNQLVVDKAYRTGDQSWRGVIVIAGNKVRGNVKLTDANTIDVKACNGFACTSFQLFRVK
jgi:hypothetical protein